jgi:hypothetical protein
MTRISGISIVIVTLLAVGQGWPDALADVAGKASESLSLAAWGTMLFVSASAIRNAITRSARQAQVED